MNKRDREQFEEDRRWRQERYGLSREAANNPVNHGVIGFFVFIISIAVIIFGYYQVLLAQACSWQDAMLGEDVSFKGIVESSFIIAFGIIGITISIAQSGAGIALKRGRVWGFVTLSLIIFPIIFYVCAALFFTSGLSDLLDNIMPDVATNNSVEVISENPDEVLSTEETDTSSELICS